MLPNLPKDSRCTWSILNNFPQAFLCNTPNAGSWQSLNSGDKWIQSILSSQGSTAFFNILQFSWKTWCGIWASLETLTPPDQVPVDAEHQSASTLSVTNSLTVLQTLTAESCQAPCGYSLSFSFFQLWRPKISAVFSLSDSHLAKPLNCTRQREWATTTGGYEPGFEPNKGEGW